MSTAVGRSGHTWMVALVAVLFSVLALGAFIQPTASAGPAPSGTTYSARVLPTTATATPQQAPVHVVVMTHVSRHHHRSAVVQRRGGRSHTGALSGMPPCQRPLGRPTLICGSSRWSDRLVDRAVTTHPLRL